MANRGNKTVSERDSKSAKHAPDPAVKGSQKAEPGTQGPDGPLDDQPQREDEYLSNVLNEFNPQKKDQKTPLKPARTKGGSQGEDDTDKGTS